MSYLYFSLVNLTVPNSTLANPSLNNGKSKVLSLIMDEIDFG